MDELLNKIKEAGIKVSDDHENHSVHVAPHYRGNIGFFHISASDWELALVKGVYKDNIRHISGKCPYDDRKINEIAQTLADIERTLRQAVSVGLAFDEDKKHVITHAMPYQSAEYVTDKRDPQIPSPISAVELSLGKGDSINDKHLFSKSAFAEIMPETLSPFAMSLAVTIPDVLNPLFMSSSIKTLSPSIKLLFGRLYMNMANAETIISTFKQTSDFLMLNFAPAVFKSIKKPSLGIPNDSDLKISDEEILESIQDILESIKDIKAEDLYSDDFIELIALAIMTWEMVYIRLWKAFTSVNKLLGKDISDTLCHIYKTRHSTILNKDFTDVHTCFDPAVSPHDISSCNLKHVSMDDMYKSIPAAKRLTLGKNKYTEKINDAHKYLSIRDELFMAVSELTMRVRNILNETGKQFVNDNMLTDKSDIFLFETTEIKNILNDEFYGNIPFTINFRRWQNARFSALALPYNLYEKDVEKASGIAQTQIEKSEQIRNIPCISLFHKEVYSDNYAKGLIFRLDRISRLENPEAVITESANMFSFITEYCAVTDTPLYTGARFANILLDNNSITTHKDHINYK